MNFLLNNEEKKAFYKVIRAVMMFDFNINADERKILKEIKTNIFYLDESPQPPVADDDSKQERERINKFIAIEINKIESLIPLVYLFNIIYELEQYNKVKDYKYKDRIDEILNLVDKKEDIQKSKLFIHNKSKIKDKPIDNNNLVSGVKNIFSNITDMFSENKEKSDETDHKGE